MKLDDVDLLAGTWEREVPHEMFELLRREAPVFFHPEPDGRGFWAVTKHADVVAVSRDPVTYSSEMGATFITDQKPADLAAMRLSILNMDAPEHNRHRRLVSKAFTPRMIQGHRRASSSTPCAPSTTSPRRASASSWRTSQAAFPSTSSAR